MGKSFMGSWLWLDPTVIDDGPEEDEDAAADTDADVSDL